MQHRHTRVTRVLALVAVLTLGACSSGGSDNATTSTTAGGVTSSVATKGNAAKGAVAPDVAGAPAPVSQLSGPITVGLDFNPEVDGFSFENYGNVADRPNLTPTELQRYFGDVVCASTADGACVLTPPAEQWMQAINEGMNGGHCEGMAALALLLKKGTAKATDFGADLAGALQIDGNAALAQEIAFWFATQALEPTTSAELKNLRPSEVVAKLRDSFTSPDTESYTLGIYKTIQGQKTEGHAITPFGLVDLPDGKVEIAIYDNNFPGQTRAVVVDPASETWSYSTATNPSEPVGLYEGNAETFSLTITPTSARLQAQTCPFCGGGAGGAAARGSKGAAGGDAGSGEDFGFVFLGDAGDDAGVELKITDLDDQPLPGLQELEFKGQDGGGSLAQDDAAPAIMVPLGVPFKVTIDGTNVTETAQTDVTYIGDGLDLYIDDIGVDPGQVDQAIFDPANGSITYSTAKTEAPTIGAGFSSDEADYAFAIGGVDLPDGGTVEAALNLAAGTFAITNRDEVAGTYALGMVRIDDAGEQTFTDEGFELPAGASVAIDFRDWSSTNDKLKVTVDLGDGSEPATAELETDR